MNKVKFIVIALIALTFTLPSYALFGKKDEAKEEQKAPELPPLKGPKKIVAVHEFENKAEAPQHAWWDHQKLGRGMSDMLVTALMESNYFIVLEREELQEGIIAEQNLAASGRTTAQGHAKIGKILQAQALIKGAVTIFDEGTKSGGKGGGITIKGISVGLGGGGGESQVGIDMRIFDTASSQVLAARSCKGFAKSKKSMISLGINRGDGSASFGGDKMEKSPLGDAMRDAITNCLLFIIEELNKIPWSGKVIKITDSGQIYINAGSRNNVNIGEQFLVFKVGEEIIDPDSGETLGAEESQIGEIKIVSLQDKFAICSPVSGSNFEKDNTIRFK